MYCSLSLNALAADVFKVRVFGKVCIDVPERETHQLEDWGTLNCSMYYEQFDVSVVVPPPSPQAVRSAL